MTKPYQVKDHYFFMAKEQGYRARSAFKLEEIDKKFRLIDEDHVVVDLGAAPGSWTQYLARQIKTGKVFALDLQEMEPLGIVEMHQIDVTNVEEVDMLCFPQVDGVVADLAPKTTGVHDSDAYHSAELNYAVLDFCERYLKPGGYMVSKIFQGEDFQGVVARSKKMFKLVKCFKPPACRDRSRETYIVAMGLKKSYAASPLT
jgi:23S rRNA (uridine2552-2'-O)-methyltransferase